jgi:hypothetical protein
MKGKILITDTLFITSQNERQITDAGYGFERLDTPTATEEQLIEALEGKVGYRVSVIEKSLTCFMCP